MTAEPTPDTIAVPVELLRRWHGRANGRIAASPTDVRNLIAWCDEHLPPEPDPLDAWKERLADAMSMASNGGPLRDVVHESTRQGYYRRTDAIIAALPESAREAMRREAP